MHRTRAFSNQELTVPTDSLGNGKICLPGTAVFAVFSCFLPAISRVFVFLFPVYDLVFAFFLICLDALSSPGTVDTNNFCKPGPFFGAN